MAASAFTHFYSIYISLALLVESVNYVVAIDMNTYWLCVECTERKGYILGQFIHSRNTKN